MCANPVGKRPTPPEGPIPDAKRTRLSPDAEIAGVAATALAVSPNELSRPLAPGRVTPPKADMDHYGNVTISYQGHEYTYNLTEPAFAAGTYNDVFTEFICIDYPEEYVFIINKNDVEGSVELQTNTYHYMKDLHREKTLSHIETPGHLIIYKDPKKGEVKTALWTRKYNNRDLYDYFLVKGANPDAGMCKQVIKGMQQLMEKGSTYLDLKIENIGVDVINGVSHLYIRDFDYVFNLPKNLEDEGVFSDVNVVSTLIDKLKYLGEEAVARATTPEQELEELLTYKDGLVSLLNGIKTSLSRGQAIKREEKKSIVFVLDDLKNSLQQIQAFQLGTTLYSIMEPSHDDPYTLTDKGPDFSSPNDMSWLVEGEFKEMLLKMLDEDPKNRTDFLV